MRRVSCILLLAMLLLVSREGSPQATGGLETYLKQFSSVPSRMPGSAGHQQAADFIERRFRQAGLQKVVREPFESVIPVDLGARMESGTTRVPLFCVWPNLVRTSTVGPEGITGRLLYGGNGALRNLAGQDIRDSIVVLDFTSGMAWTDLAMLGARAFVFLESPVMSRREAEDKFVDIPLNVPRFYARREHTRDILQMVSQGTPVTVTGRMEWSKVPDWNICGVLPGRDPKLKEELVILQAYYDGISVVPALAPGATGACGISVLLELLDALVAAPPRRSVMFLATSGHYQMLKGVDAFTQKHLRTVAPFVNAIKPEDRIKPRLFIGLDLSSGSSQIGVWHNSGDFYYQRFFAPFGKKFAAYAAAVCRNLGLDPELAFVNGISPEKGIIWQTYLPETIVTDGSIPVGAGVAALSLVTVNDGRWNLDTPSDTFGSLNLENIRRQSALIRGMVKTALDDPDLLPPTTMEIQDKLLTLIPRIVTFNPRKSFIPSDPVEGALVIPRYDTDGGGAFSKTRMGVRGTILDITGPDGKATISRIRGGGIRLQAFTTDPVTGDIVLAPDMGVGGNQQYPVTVGMDYRLKEWMIVLFPCKAVNVYGLVDPQYLSQISKIEIFDTANRSPDMYGYYLQFFEGIPWSWTSRTEPFGVIFAKPGTRFKLAGQSGLLGIRMLLLNGRKSLTSKAAVEGEGFPVDELHAITDVPYQAALDMLHLDHYRAYNFQKFGIRNERLKELQDQSTALLAMADQARERHDWFNFLKYSRQSQAIESRAYPDVKNTANDVVQGVIFYFLMLLPFAYFGERLLFGFPRLERRIAGVFGIFLAIYYVMRLVHPAFKLTNAPEIILLGFIVLALSMIVLSIVTSKFEEQMQRLKREASQVYETDVGRVTAVATAFSLGVANMKRRKMRTILTSITLILLTFTVLSFTSIKSYLRFNQVVRPNRPSYPGLLLRDRTWMPLQEIALEYTGNEFSDSGILAPRSWMVLGELGSRTAIQVLRGDRAFLASGLLGLTEQEKDVTGVHRTLVAGRWFSASDPDYLRTCILPRKIARTLGIAPDSVGKETVAIYGRQFIVGGIFDEEAFEQFRDLDDEPMAPVDFSAIADEELTKIRSEKANQLATMQTKIQSFIHSSAENTVILPHETVMAMPGTLHSVAVRFHEDVSIRKLVEDFVSKLAVTVFAGVGDRTYVYSSLGLTSFSGMGNLLVPILIAAMIVLNTMMGSVHERIKEIGTYSAVGLAPVHISSLFLAESMVYAVMGAVAGYLLGQVMSKVLIATGLLKGLVLNYSSLSAVFATVIIFITVLLSTLYPARKAARMAVPDVTRKWVLPEPKGDEWTFEFPFTVSEIEVLGLTTFLTQYFNSYQDVSLGTFYTNGAQLRADHTPGGKSRYHIETEIWLAPFDLGVSQRMTVMLEPLGQYNFYTIRIFLTRTSGEASDWKRLNRRFLDGIRKQFLIWRTIAPEDKKQFEEKGKAALAAA